jgi:hypothetical protein
MMLMVLKTLNNDTKSSAKNMHVLARHERLVLKLLKHRIVFGIRHRLSIRIITVQSYSWVPVLKMAKYVEMVGAAFEWTFKSHGCYVRVVHH